MTPLPPLPPILLAAARPFLARTAAAALLAAGGTAHAQNAQPAPTDPPTPPPSRVEEAERVLPRVNRNAPVITPTRPRVAQPVRPGLTGGEDWGDGIDLRPTGLPEGTFLIERPGRIVQAPGGRKVFVPTGDDRRAGEGPMLILPNATLERLELALTHAGDEPGVRVSGEIFVYHGRSHLLLASTLMGEGEPATPPPPAEPDEPTTEQGVEPPANRETGPTDDPASVLDDPDVRGLLEELEAARPTAPNTDTRPVPTPSPTDSTVGRVPPVPDGTPVVRRRGRLIRTGDAGGAWAFVFDNDTDDTLKAEAMVVMPCLLLQRMESQALASGDAHQLTVSGRVHTHNGQAYLLPTTMLRVPVTGVVPMQ